MGFGHRMKALGETYTASLSDFLLQVFSSHPNRRAKGPKGKRPRSLSGPTPNAHHHGTLFFYGTIVNKMETFKALDVPTLSCWLDCVPSPCWTMRTAVTWDSGWGLRHH